MIEEAQRHDEAFALSSVGRTKLHQSALAGAPDWATLISLSMPFLARLSRAVGVWPFGLVFASIRSSNLARLPRAQWANAVVASTLPNVAVITAQRS